MTILLDYSESDGKGKGVGGGDGWMSNVLLPKSDRVKITDFLAWYLYFGDLTRSKKHQAQNTKLIHLMSKGQIQLMLSFWL
jgi:hypothetical protein